MQEYFNNSPVVSDIYAHTERIAKLKNERNWTMGIAIGVILIIGMAYYLEVKKNKKEIQTNNHS